jgi:hypothetical protein
MNLYQQLENPNGLLSIEPEQKQASRTNILAGHQLYVDQGLMKPDPLYEATANMTLGYFLASFQKQTQAGITNVLLKSELPEEVAADAQQIMQAVHKYNQGFYQQTDSVGSNFAVQVLTDPNILKQARLMTDRTDSFLTEIFGQDQLLKTTLAMNDKAAYKELYQGSTSLEVTSPKTGVITGIDQDLLNEFNSGTYPCFYQFLIKLISQGQVTADGITFDPNTQYFIKVSSGRGGIGITRLTPKHSKELLQVCTYLCEVRASGGKPQLLISEPLNVDSTLNNPNPTNLEYDTYFSPCLTLRLTEAKTTLGQAADQVLANGTDYIGSYFNAQLQEKFLQSLGPNPALLAKALKQVGYEGYFGTDYIRLKNPGSTAESYGAVIDGNARMNGNDVLYLVRRAAASSGIQVNDGFLTFLARSGQYENMQEFINNELAQYSYDPKTESGAVLVPSISLDNTCKEAEQSAGVVYLNPRQDKERFTNFFEKII